MRTSRLDLSKYARHPLLEGPTPIQQRAAELEAQGRKAYVCPLGGSSPVGCLGYADCAAEIVTQADAMGVTFDRVIVANGSGGMHAGFVAGFVALGLPRLVSAFTVYSPAEKAHALTLEKADQTIKLIEPNLAVDADAVSIDEGELGQGYGIPTDGMRAAVRLLASKEGLLLDPVYSGKAFSGLVHGAKTGRYAPGQNILFVMTGGLPGLFAYRSAF